MKNIHTIIQVVQIIVTLEISENKLNFRLLKDNILAMTFKKKKKKNNIMKRQLNKTSAISYCFSS